METIDLIDARILELARGYSPMSMDTVVYNETIHQNIVLPLLDRSVVLAARVQKLVAKNLLIDNGNNTFNFNVNEQVLMRDYKTPEPFEGEFRVEQPPQEETPQEVIIPLEVRENESNETGG